jgi:hypothetical protein
MNHPDYTTGPARVFLPILANLHSKQQVTIVAGYVEVRDGDSRWHERDYRYKTRRST